MKSSSAKTLGVILVVFAVLALVGILRFLIWVPLGVGDGVGHGLRSGFFDRDWSWAWVWPWAGVAGFFGIALPVFLDLGHHLGLSATPRSGGWKAILWALLVFFLHWIGLVIYLIVRSGRPVIPASRPAPPAPLSPPPVIVTPPPVKPAACPACGKPAQPEWSVCPFCGSKL